MKKSLCELKVINKIREKEQKVGEDIIYAKLNGDHILLKDILGSIYKVHGAIIEEVNINSEILKLVSSPLIPKLHQFLIVCNKCESEKSYNKEVESLWKEIKTSGDEFVSLLWKKYGG